MAIDPKLIDKLLADYKRPEDIIGKNGLLRQLTKAVLERALNAELTDHLGSEEHDPLCQRQPCLKSRVGQLFGGRCSQSKFSAAILSESEERAFSSLRPRTRAGARGRGGEDRCAGGVARLFTVNVV